MLVSPVRVRADEPELIKARATAYVLRGKTYTGTETRSGICATGNKDLLNKVILVYQRKGEEIGDLLYILECVDTGCSPYVIDIWAESMDEAQQIMDTVYKDGCNGKIYIQAIDAEG